MIHSNCTLSNRNFLTLFLGVSQLAIILSEEQEDHIKAATVWALGQIGGHTPEHAKAIAVSNVLPRYD